MTPAKVKSPAVLQIDYDRYAQGLLRRVFSSETYALYQAGTAGEGLRVASELFPDMILLDLSLPDMDGHKVIARLRESTAAPIIVISARNQPGDKIQALDMGANDFVDKPFDVGELLARIRAGLRSRSDHAVSVEKIRNGPLEVDFRKRLVLVDGKEVFLTPREYTLLLQLLRNLGCVMTHQQLLSKVWGQSSVDEVQYLRVYIGYLRRKLGRAAEALRTQPGIGYRMARWADPAEKAGRSK
jgi:two-component system KDP operon response regulator KdpE